MVKGPLAHLEVWEGFLEEVTLDLSIKGEELVRWKENGWGWLWQKREKQKQKVETILKEIHLSQRTATFSSQV